MATNLVAAASSFAYSLMAPLSPPSLGRFFQQAPQPLPDFALTYAPHTYLYSQEQWFCSDVTTHLAHMSVEINYTNVSSSVTLGSLNEFNSSTFLTSYDDVEDNPPWLLSTYGKPNATGYSEAPGTIIAVNKTDFIDVFYFYFYSYNHGALVLGDRKGNHVGDWEHSMIRFANNGTPESIYYSAHSSGRAYTFNAVNKVNQRPIVYSATGSHANYASNGTHRVYAIIGNIVTDVTDAGLYWDMTQNFRAYWYDNSSATFTPALGVGPGGVEQQTEKVDWLYWLGRWGDEQYKDSDPRQDCFLGIDELCHYGSGPTGPVDKNLGRRKVCEHEAEECDVRDSLEVVQWESEVVMRKDMGGTS